MADQENTAQETPRAESPRPAPSETRSEAPPRRASRDRRGGGRPGRDRRRFGGRRRRVCRMCLDKVKAVDYKSIDLLRQFVSPSGRIVGRRKTRLCAKHQRMIARAIKRARHLALLPYTAEHIRRM